MTTTRQRVVALVLALMVAVAVAFAASATVAIEEAHADIVDDVFDAIYDFWLAPDPPEILPCEKLDPTGVKFDCYKVGDFPEPDPTTAPA